MFCRLEFWDNAEWVTTQSMNAMNSQAGRNGDLRSDEWGDGDRRRISTPFTYTIAGPNPVAYVEIYDADGRITRISVPPGSIWKMAKISLS